jgi:hypothetical protein
VGAVAAPCVTIRRPSAMLQKGMSWLHTMVPLISEGGGIE